MEYFASAVTGCKAYVEGAPVEQPVKSFSVPAMQRKVGRSDSGAFGMDVPCKMDAIEGIKVTFQGPPVEVLKYVGHTNPTPSVKINGAVENPISSASSNAAMTTSRPVRMPPSVCSTTRLRKSLSTSV